MVVRAMIDFATTASLGCRQTTDLRHGPMLSHGAQWSGDAVANDPPMTPIDGHIGRRIRGKRRALGLSEDDLARALGVGRDAIEAYERAALRVPPEHLIRLAEFLGVSISYFFPTQC
jgi:ribosome-binding protein aMBF1 (putative translation factor)